MSKPPHVAVWVDVPNDCRMTGQFESDDNFYFLVGDPNDEVHLRFEPEAMKRFVELVQRMLANPAA